jgi:heme/copper-type cytochrome/quinol oxidase subunit 4
LDRSEPGKGKAGPGRCSRGGGETVMGVIWTIVVIVVVVAAVLWFLRRA